MKKLFSVIVFSLVLASVYAEDTIDIVSRQIITGSINNGTMIGSSWGVWTPYLNGEKISETYFYHITGDEIAELASRRRRVAAASLFWGGLFSTAGGCALLWTTDEEGAQVYAGLGFAGVGIGCLFASIPFGAGNTRPAQYALRLADSFNQTH